MGFGREAAVTFVQNKTTENFMRVIILLLVCVAAQAQLKPEIVPLASVGPDWLLKPLGNAVEEKWSLNEKESTLKWMGKPIVGGGHEGTIQFVSGSITFSTLGLPTAGDFLLDMNTIKSTDVKQESGAKDLEDHLKSDDFFSVTKYPRANFSILKVIAQPSGKGPQQIKVTGLLTIKGITNQVVFPATIIRDKGELLIKADLKIDRTKWDINYQSKSIFTNLKDGIISDEVTLAVELKFVGC